MKGRIKWEERGGEERGGERTGGLALPYPLGGGGWTPCLHIVHVMDTPNTGQASLFVRLQVSYFMHHCIVTGGKSVIGGNWSLLSSFACSRF
jgi:hypothetical protein